MTENIISSPFANPLFSFIITLYTLILLYFPSYFLGLASSPVLISTFILVLCLLRLRATQEQNEKQNKKEKELGSAGELNSAGSIVDELSSVVATQEEEDEKGNGEEKELNSARIVIDELNSAGDVPEESASASIVPEILDSGGNIGEELNSAEIDATRTISRKIPECFDDEHNWASSQVNGECRSGSGSDPDSFLADSFLEWDVRAPLEVIHEAYEGEEGENGDVLEENRETQMAIIERYASLSTYYPETDTDTSSSEGDFPVMAGLGSLGNVGFRWDEEDGEGLIEIALDGKRKNEAEEENLIEIDLLRRVSHRDEGFSPAGK